jgi:hypothetical protein
LSGEPTWIRSGLEIFSRASTMNSHDWIQMIQGAGDYLLADIASNKRRETALFALVEACQLCLTMVSPAGVDDRDKIVELKLKVAEALSLCELVSALYLFVVSVVAVRFIYASYSHLYCHIYRQIAIAHTFWFR